MNNGRKGRVNVSNVTDLGGFRPVLLLGEREV